MLIWHTTCKDSDTWHEARLACGIMMCHTTWHVTMSWHAHTQTRGAMLRWHVAWCCADTLHDVRQFDTCHSVTWITRCLTSSMTFHLDRRGDRHRARHGIETWHDVEIVMRSTRSMTWHRLWHVAPYGSNMWHTVVWCGADTWHSLGGAWHVAQFRTCDIKSTITSATSIRIVHKTPI
jgi:hypothetical protein